MKHGRRLLWISLALAVVGLGVAALWVRWIGGAQSFGVFRNVRWTHALLLLAVTATFVGMRFVRWQYLLRRVDVPVPARDSLRVYLASLAGTATPGYVGEVVRCAFLRKRFGSPLARTLLCLFVERLLDVGTLAVIGACCGGPWWQRAVMAGIALLAVLALRVSARVAAHFDSAHSSFAELTRPGTLLFAAAGSVVVWLPVTVGLQLASAGLSLDLPWLDSLRIYTSSTLFGALTLMPAGFGATGSAQIVQLQEFGFTAASAVAVVTLFRALTTGVCLSLGVVFLLLELRGRKASAAQGSEHFDALAAEYNAQFRPHVWNYLLQKRVRLMADTLPPPAEAGFGLDLGCGLGLQGQAMQALGFKVIGVDPAVELLRFGQKNGLTTVVGDGLALPFADDSLRFVYSVGVLHHLKDRAAQEAACREIARVLAPGGALIVQETNTRNPLFRFYMGYVFPMLSRIDEGTEHWIEPDRWEKVDGLECVKVHYFTFLPDFIPAKWMPPFLALEKKLEGSRARPYSVHYQALLRKPGRDRGAAFSR